MFEAISDSELSEQSTVPETDCEIEVCPTSPQFEDINTVERPTTRKSITITPLTEWWPTTAEHVLRALYASKETKRSAVKQLMNLFEYQRKEVGHLRLPTEELYELRTLYNQKLSLIEKYAFETKNVWCDALRTCATKCRQAFNQRETNLHYLTMKAQDIARKHSRDKTVMHILQYEFAKSSKDIEEECVAQIYIVKLDYHIKPQVYDLCALQACDTKIRELETRLLEKYDESMLEHMRESFEAEFANIDYEISQQLQRECEEYWMEALT